MSKIMRDGRVQASNGTDSTTYDASGSSPIEQEDLDDPAPSSDNVTMGEAETSCVDPRNLALPRGSIASLPNDNRQNGEPAPRDIPPSHNNAVMVRGTSSPDDNPQETMNGSSTMTLRMEHPEAPPRQLVPRDIRDNELRRW